MKRFIIIFIVIFFSGTLIYFNKSSSIKLIKKLLPDYYENIVRYYYFNLPENFPLISQFDPVQNDISIKKKLLDLTFVKKRTQKISLFNSSYDLNVFMPNKNILMSGIANKYAGSFYIDYYNQNLFILSSKNILAYGKISDKKILLKQIKNNLNFFIGDKAFAKDRGLSVKDLKIFNEKIYISFTDEIKSGCWATSVLSSTLSLSELKFDYLFRPKDCLSENNAEGFVPIQSGGRLDFLDNQNLLLTTGDYRARNLSQNKNSSFGKMIKINLQNNSFKFLSKGHRNSQGLLVDKDSEIILTTDHGPQGGDEINLLEFIDMKKNSIVNYGWPISSYGEHYGAKDKNYAMDPNLNRANDEYINNLYKKYPLYKSHKKYNFVEPIKYFTPSIGISQIIGIGNSKYIASSLGAKIIYLFELSNNRIILDKKMYIGERIRDIVYADNKIFFSLEDTSSIGILNYK